MNVVFYATFEIIIKLNDSFTQMKFGDTERLISLNKFRSGLRLRMSLKLRKRLKLKISLKLRIGTKQYINHRS
jgi:hypothetical protein